MPWNVTTDGDLPDDHEHRDRDASIAAWSDYWGRILEFEIHGYVGDGEETVELRPGVVHHLVRYGERIDVRIERTA